MSYQPPYIYRGAPPVRRGMIRRPPAPAAGAQRIGLGDLGASAGVTLAQAGVSTIPVIGPLLSNVIGPLASILDPGAKRDAGRKQRCDGITALANAGSLLAARQLYGAAEKGAVGAASEKALYVTAWTTFQQAHQDIATAARAAGPSGVGPDPVNGWNPPPADVAQYQNEIQAYRVGGIAATAAAAAGARAAGFPGGIVGMGIAAGLAAKLLGIL